MAFDLQASQGAVLQMVNHGVVVAAAFVIVGDHQPARAPDDRLDDIGGLAAGAPRLAGIFLIVAMASLAIPGSNTFVGEFFILTGVFRQHLWLAVARLHRHRLRGRLHAAAVPDDDERAAAWRPPGGAAELRGARLACCCCRWWLAMLVIALWPNGHRGRHHASPSSARSRRPRWPPGRPARPDPRARGPQPAGRRAAAAGRPDPTPPRPGRRPPRERQLTSSPPPRSYRRRRRDPGVRRRPSARPHRAPPRPRRRGHRRHRRGHHDVGPSSGATARRPSTAACAPTASACC